MPVSEITEIIVQLLTLFWSAAAGNIQLSSTSPKIISGSTATLTDDLSEPTMIVIQQSASSTSNSQMDKSCEDMLLETDTTADTSKEAVENENDDLAKITDTASSFLLRKEVKFFLPDHSRLSTGSNMSTGSVESSTSTVNQLSPSQPRGGCASGDGQLQAGCCIRQKADIKIKDIKIASKAIEIISCFVQYRKGRFSILLMSI
jgi:hypothetical protein